MSFLANDNKNMLWEMLLDNGSFTYLSGKEEAIRMFEDTIKEIDELNPTVNVLNKNKLFLGKFINIVSTKANNNLNNNVIDNKNITREKQLEERNNMFEKRLRARQEEFSSMISKPKPVDIDFSDNNKDINGNIDELYEKISNDRDRDLMLNVSNEEQKKATEWLNNGNKPVILNIDHNSNLKPLDEKKVTFNIEDKEKSTVMNDTLTGNFFSKLKRDDIGIDNILRELSEIKETQWEILSILKMDAKEE